MSNALFSPWPPPFGPGLRLCTTDGCSRLVFFSSTEAHTADSDSKKSRGPLAVPLPRLLVLLAVVQLLAHEVPNDLLAVFVLV